MERRERVFVEESLELASGLTKLRAQPPKKEEVVAKPLLG
jgi:hypothetical protein